MGHQYRYPIPYEQYSYPQQQQYQSQMPPAPSQQATNICQLCQSQGHYDYCCDMGQNDTIGKIELNPSFVLSSNNTNYKNDIQLFPQLFDELRVNGDYH